MIFCCIKIGFGVIFYLIFNLFVVFFIFLLKILSFLFKILANINKVCTFVMLVNYYYIFGLKKALVTALFL